ncbi:hypothetical protein [Albimonas pacifica]|uniref:Uncharacterized protein n=1 Tax=Albimonas pacifica TaxID=1114924 RepID=A0A1I3LJY0_9RHOB|nr:hypothetical protein [Albimonas pacifica]SFI85033.1 hypothetical protein SAMN05216258_11066 [Albimonas pacifica]
MADREIRPVDGRAAKCCADALSETLATIDPATQNLVLSGIACHEVVRLLRLIPQVAAGTHVVVPVEAANKELELQNLRAAPTASRRETAEALALVGKMREALEPFSAALDLAQAALKSDVPSPLHVEPLARGLIVNGALHKTAAALSAPAPAALESMRERIANEATAEMREALQDPVRVHANMLRGTVAKPTLPNLIHLMPDEFKAMRAEIRAEALEEAARKVSGYAGRYDGADVAPLAAAIRAMKREGEG